MHPFASVTVYEYAPAPTVYEPVPKYGAVPPEAETVTVDVPPLQAIEVELEAEDNADGPEIVIV